MSYDIDSIDYLSGELKLPVPVYLPNLGIDYLPEGCFLLHPEETMDGHTIKKLWWHGEGSGNGFEDFKKILACTVGEADLLICWEGGDSYTGLRVTNGKVVEHEVVHALGAPKE